MKFNSLNEVCYACSHQKSPYNVSLTSVKPFRRINLKEMVVDILADDGLQTVTIAYLCICSGELKYYILIQVKISVAVELFLLYTDDRVS